MKHIKLLILSIGVLLTCFGCFKTDAYDNIDIAVTSYPIEYITNYLYGNYANIKMIYPSGVNPNEYELTPKQVKDISKNDMFIYNGLSKEKNIAANILSRNKKIDIIDVSKGLESTNKEAELWLSPMNFLMLASNVKNSLKEYLSNQNIIDNIDKNYNELKIKVSEIDVELKTTAENANSKKIIVANNSLLFLNNYGFEVISIDDGENKTSNLSNAKSLIKNKDNEYIFVLSGYKETEELNDLVKTGGKIVEINSLYTISEEQRKNNEDYLYFIKNMVENIKTEVY